MHAFPSVEELSTNIAELVKGAGHAVSFDSARHYAGRAITIDLIQEFSWLLAANAGSLRKGVPLRPYSGPFAASWHPAVVEAFAELRGRSCFWWRIMCGPFAGQAASVTWNLEALRIAARIVGYSWKLAPKYDAYRLHQPGEMVGMQAFILVESTQALEPPRIKLVRCPDQAKAANRKLMMQRTRRRFVCPFNYRHPCFACPIGQDKCSASVHLKTYQEGACPSCSQSCWQDPDARTRLQHCNPATTSSQ